MNTMVAAARAFERIIRDYEQEQDAIRKADTKFDGGEFSAYWHDRQDQSQYSARIALVAQRFNVPSHDLRQHLYARPYVEQDRMLDALQGETP